MQAIEFFSKAHDGVVDLPREYQEWNGKQVRVTLLEATGLEATVLEATSEAAKRKTQFKAASISTRDYRFSRDAANER